LIPHSAHCHNSACYVPPRALRRHFVLSATHVCHGWTLCTARSARYPRMKVVSAVRASLIGHAMIE